MKTEDYIWDYRNSYEWMQRVMGATFPPMIITCAITGGVQGKEININLPETAEEQADAVYEAYKAGGRIGSHACPYTGQPVHDHIKSGGLLTH